MRRLEIHYLRATNIRCFGPKGIEIHFKDYGNLVQIKGINLDAPGTDDDPASNGAGKSSIQEILTIGFYGRPVKDPKKNHANEFMNVLADKAEVEIRWDDCRLVRTFNRTKTGSITSKLQVWQSTDKIWDKPLDLMGIEANQAFIDRNLGLSHHAFCNIAIFDDSDSYAFLQSDAATKRLIAENLLDLDQYRSYHQNAKDLLKDLKKKLDGVGREYSLAQDEYEASDRRLITLFQQEANWRTVKTKELEQIQQRLQADQTALAKCNESEQMTKWENAQQKIAALHREIANLETNRGTLLTAINAGRKKLEAARQERTQINANLQSFQLEVASIQSDLNKAMKLIGGLEDLKEGAACPVCHGTIQRANYGHVVEHGQATVEKCKTLIDRKSAAIEVEVQAFGTKSAAVTKMEERIAEADAKVNAIDVKIRKNQAEVSELSRINKPDVAATIQILEERIATLRRDVELRQQELGKSPYKEIMDQTAQEKTDKGVVRDAKKVELAELEAEVPYLEYWVEAFGDNGIRKYVIDNIMPTLNERIAYWLQILIDGLIDLKFDNTFKETITRNGNPVSYHAMSKGELRRINLSIPQAFAYVTTLNAGCCPSVLFLDEITGGGIDKAGIPNVYNMIQELAKERQVFVTTHNEHLLSMLQGCECITLKKQDDITVLAS